MQDAIDAAPFRQHSHERTRSKRFFAMGGRQQCNPSPLACNRNKNVEATRCKARLNRDSASVSVLCGQMPGAAAPLFLVESGKLAKLRWRRGFTFLCQKLWTGDEDTSAHT